MPYDELRAAAEKATKGPWFAVLYATEWAIQLGEDYGSVDCLGGDDEDTDEPGYPARGVGDQEAEANADFICLARRDIIPLLDDNDRLRARVKELEKAAYEVTGWGIENIDYGHSLERSGELRIDLSNLADVMKDYKP